MFSTSSDITDSIPIFWGRPWNRCDVIDFVMSIADTELRVDIAAEAIEFVRHRASEGGLFMNRHEWNRKVMMEWLSVSKMKIKMSFTVQVQKRLCSTK
jgi:hypothetical protein